MEDDEEMEKTEEASIGLIDVNGSPSGSESYDEENETFHTLSINKKFAKQVRTINFDD